MRKLIITGLAGLLLVGTAAKSNESIVNYNSEHLTSVQESLIFNPEELISVEESLKEVKLVGSLNIKHQRIRAPIDYKTSDFYQDSDEVLLARMLLGECEGCSETEKITIAFTPFVRREELLRWREKTLKEIILYPLQYSCFNENENAKLENPVAYNANEFFASLKLAREILAGEHANPLRATHYINLNHAYFEDNPLPEWIEKLEHLGKIEGGYHDFYMESNP